MGKGLPRSMKAGASPMRQTVIRQHYKVEDLAISVDGATGVGFGSAVLGDFPEGNILFLGAVAYMQFSGGGADAGLVDTFDGDYGIGTTPASDATITGADVDIIASAALGAATAEVSPRARGSNATQAIFDNTDGSLELNLNLLIDDANISADDVAITANGDLVILYAVMMDD